MLSYRALLTMISWGYAALQFAHATDGTFDSNGVKIRYVVEGQGEPVVLIHGWMGDSSMWGVDKYGNTKLTPAPGFQVIALDCRGHGKSDKPHDKGQYGAEMAADVVGLMDHLKLRKAHLIGYSMGAFIAGKVVATHPERILSVIYGGQAPLLTGEAGSDEIRVFAKAVDEGKGLGAYILTVAPKDKPKPTMAQANAFATLMFAGKDVKAIAAAGLSFDKLEVSRAALVKAKAPTMFVYGSKESVNLRVRVASLQKALGQAQVRVIEGGNHITTLRSPAFGAAIVGFLQAHRHGVR